MATEPTAPFETTFSRNDVQSTTTAVHPEATTYGDDALDSTVSAGNDQPTTTPNASLTADRHVGSGSGDSGEGEGKITDVNSGTDIGIGDGSHMCPSLLQLFQLPKEAKASVAAGSGRQGKGSKGGDRSTHSHGGSRRATRALKLGPAASGRGHVEVSYLDKLHDAIEDFNNDQVCCLPRPVPEAAADDDNVDHHEFYVSNSKKSQLNLEQKRLHTFFAGVGRNMAAENSNQRSNARMWPVSLAAALLTVGAAVFMITKSRHSLDNGVYNQLESRRQSKSVGSPIRGVVDWSVFRLDHTAYSVDGYILPHDRNDAMVMPSPPMSPLRRSTIRNRPGSPSVTERMFGSEVHV
jgi:hypothetical protein